MSIDFNDAFKGGSPNGGSKGPGVQGLKGNLKYTGVVPAFEIKNGTRWRPYLPLDPQTGQFKDPVVEGTFTWVKFVGSVRYAGLRWPPGPGEKWPSSRQLHFWLVPSDIRDIFGDDMPVDQMSAKEFAIQNSPYSLMVYAAQRSADDHTNNPPPEWSQMLDTDDWCDLLGVGNPQQHHIYAPLSWPGESALMQGQLLSHDKIKGNPSRMQYEDGRSPGSLHPAIIELSKTGAREIQEAIRGEHDFLTLDGSEANPNGGMVLRAEYYAADAENSARYEISLDQQRDVNPNEMAAEWHPWDAPQQFSDGVRDPVLNRMTAAEQIDELIWAFGGAFVEYSLIGTPYEDHIPDKWKGSFEETQQILAKNGKSWIQHIHEQQTGGGMQSAGPFIPGQGGGKSKGRGQMMSNFKNAQQGQKPAQPQQPTQPQQGQQAQPQQPTQPQQGQQGQQGQQAQPQQPTQPQQGQQAQPQQPTQPQQGQQGQQAGDGMPSREEVNKAISQIGNQGQVTDASGEGGGQVPGGVSPEDKNSIYDQMAQGGQSPNQPAQGQEQQPQQQEESSSEDLGVSDSEIPF